MFILALKNPSRTNLADNKTLNVSEIFENITKTEAHFHPISTFPQVLPTVATPTNYENTKEWAIAMMQDIQELAESFTNKTDVFFANVTSLLSETWNRDFINIKLFRYVCIVYGEMINHYILVIIKCTRHRTVTVVQPSLICVIILPMPDHRGRHSRSGTY